MGKRKNKIRPLSATRFMVLWIMLAAVIYFTRSTISLNLLSTSPASESIHILYALIITIFVQTFSAIGQAHLLQRLFQRSLRFWVPVTVGAMLITTLLSYFPFFIPSEFLAQFREPFQFIFFLTFLALPSLMIPAFGQWLVLHRRIKYAWLWLAAGIVSIVPFVGFNLLINATMGLSDLPLPLWFIYTIVQAAIMGFAADRIAKLARRDNNSFAINQDEDNDYGRLVEESSDPQADEAPLVQRRAQSY